MMLPTNSSSSRSNACLRLSSKSGKSFLSGVVLRRLRMCSHWPGEVVDERPRARIGEHPANLRVEHGRLAKLPATGGVEQLVVWNAAPQKERQSRRQIQIADPIRAARRRAGRIPLDAEHELGADEHGAGRQLDPAVERSLASPGVVERHQAGHVRRRSPAGDTRDGPASRRSASRTCLALPAPSPGGR